MNPDMLFLAERLVLAMETISQDVKNMSAYVYDLSYNVLRFLNDKNKDGGISVVPCSESAGRPRDPSPFAEGEFSLECEQMNGSAVPLIDDMEHEEMSVQDIGCLSNDEAESSDVLASDFVGDIKDENVIHEDFFPLPEETAIPVTIGSPEVEDSANHIMRYPEYQTTPETQEVMRACGLKGHSVHNNSQETDWTDGKLLRGDMNDGEKHPQVICRDTGASSSCSEETQRECDGKEKEDQTEKGGVARERRSTAQKKGKASARKSLSEQSGRQKKNRGPLHCDTCGKCFSFKLHLEVHKRIHTGERPFHCALCNKTYVSKSHLVSHMKVHSEERPYKCSTCNKSFKEKYTLRRHMRVHTGEKPFECNVCGKLFTQGSHLTPHMRLHSGEKPFVCRECGKAFRQLYHLTSHMRVHTDEHPFACKDCGRCFAHSSGLKHHGLLVHGVASSVSESTA